MIATFQAKRSGLLDAIKLKRRRSLESIKEESSFEALLQEAPLPLPVPRLFYVDATPEALVHALETGWPSAGAASSLTVNATITGLRFCFVAVLWPVDALEQMSPVDEVRTLLAAYSACLTGAAALPGRITSYVAMGS